MNANEREELNDLMEKVVGAVYEVSNKLGSGFLEKVYERALIRELDLRGIRAESQVPMKVSYKGGIVGEYVADIFVDKKLLVELKCVDTFQSEHIAQCINYLKASDQKILLLVNFQHSKVEWKRVVLDF